MDLDNIALTTIDGAQTTLAAYPGVRLIVNVASRCGFTPQYAGLERLWEKYKDQGLWVLGFPTNQFLQEMAGEDAIKEFCAINYGVTFPMFAKVRVNGRSQHPLFAELTRAADAEGKAGKVAWNFEKFLVAPDGAVHRFRSKVEPEDPAVVDRIEEALAR
jgi:glutathione peroxidase